MSVRILRAGDFASECAQCQAALYAGDEVCVDRKSGEVFCNTDCRDFFRYAVARGSTLRPPKKRKVKNPTQREAERQYKYKNAAAPAAPPHKAAPAVPPHKVETATASQRDEIRYWENYFYRAAGLLLASYHYWTPGDGWAHYS